jgi:hypothetical protein
MMVRRLILIVTPALFGVSSVDLCLFDGQYTYWVLSTATAVVPF